MGKNLRQQARGKGSPRYRSPGHRYLGNVSYAYIPAEAKEGVVVGISDAPGRTTPLATIDFGGKKVLQIPNEGMNVGQKIHTETAETKEGDILELEKIPEGSKIYNIELRPGDGGRLCRSSGNFATLITKESGKAVLLLPSKQKKTLLTECRATIGAAAGSGRIEKPFRKAGLKYHAMRAMGRLYPRVSGVAMNSVDHPFGGSAKPGKHKTVSRHAPPGRKVGSLAARRMGKKKRK